MTTSSRALALLLLLASACGPPDPAADIELQRRVAPDADRCAATVEELCAGDPCVVNGLPIPKRVERWCDQRTPSELIVRQDTCGDDRKVALRSGDQDIELYYDVAGDLYAITRWVSEPPCEGACRLSCTAGPSGTHTSDLPTCLGLLDPDYCRPPGA